MKCACCGEIIEGDPIWADDMPYCSEECAEIGPTVNYNEEEYEDYQDDYEEDFEVDR